MGHSRLVTNEAFSPEHISTRAVACSPDGKMLASVLGDRTVKLSDAGTGEELQMLDADVSIEPFRSPMMEDS